MSETEERRAQRLEALLVRMRGYRTAVRYHRASRYGKPLFYIAGRSVDAQLRDAFGLHDGQPLIVWGLHVRCVPGVRLELVHAG